MHVGVSKLETLLLTVLTHFLCRISTLFFLYGSEPDNHEAADGYLRTDMLAGRQVSVLAT